MKHNYTQKHVNSTWKKLLIVYVCERRINKPKSPENDKKKSAVNAIATVVKN